MPSTIDPEDVRLNYNPEEPQARFKAAGLEGALLAAVTTRLPETVPWPAGKAPTAEPLAHVPAETEDLGKFKGYDAVVVTWTAAEAAALAALFTPGFRTTDWYEYRHDVAAYVPLVTGSRAPFNDPRPDMARYHHSLGLYFPCRIGKARVLLFKSGLHLDYDGEATPVRRLMGEIVKAVQPALFITTGTGGGIGKDVALGDVVIAGLTKFSCTTQFKHEPWRSAEYPTTPMPAEALATITPALTEVNAAKVPGARQVPKIWSAPTDTIVTTDFFGFDDSTDHYRLQGPGRRACDMGDAMVGQALRSHKHVKWFAIRNASDPQMPNANHDLEKAKVAAGQIYSRYGAFTTAASVIASWAVVDTFAN
jgi:nucleoside phosphorylase